MVAAALLAALVCSMRASGAEAVRVWAKAVAVPRKVGAKRALYNPAQMMIAKARANRTSGIKRDGLRNITLRSQDFLRRLASGTSLYQAGIQGICEKYSKPWLIGGHVEM